MNRDVNRLTPTEPVNEAQDWWARAPSSEYGRAASHWLGSGIWQGDTWRRAGELHFELFKELCRFTGTARPLKRMVEWGPGGGVNAVRFAEEFKEIHGVDISPSNLDECRRQLEHVGFFGFRAVAIAASHPEAALSAVPQPCDLFLSTAVFTHFPGKNYGIRVTEIARRLLCPDGLALIQIRFSDGQSQENGTGSGSYQQAWNEYTSYTLEEYWNAAADLGLRPLYVKIHSEIGQATFALQRTR